MGKQIDYVVGRIDEMDDDRHAGWEAFYRKDYENEELREEIADLKAQIRKLQTKARKK